jgi:eukaryotic-like serine/threonine-protein kinase
MAPEKWSGAAVPESDVYSLGCVLYELVTGAPPFHGTFVDVMRGHRSVAPPPIADLRPEAPADLGALIMAMLAKAPADRPALTEVEARLAALAEPRTVAARHAGPAEHAAHVAHEPAPLAMAM